MMCVRSFQSCSLHSLSEVTPATRLVITLRVISERVKTTCFAVASTFSVSHRRVLWPSFAAGFCDLLAGSICEQLVVIPAVSKVSTVNPGQNVNHPVMMWAGIIFIGSSPVGRCRKTFLLFRGIQHSQSHVAHIVQTLRPPSCFTSVIDCRQNQRHQQRNNAD